MAKIDWQDAGWGQYSGGAHRGVLYRGLSVWEPWYGITSVSEISQTSVESDYDDGTKVRDRATPNDFTARITSYTYPSILDDYDSGLNLTYRTPVYDHENNEVGYKLHLIYNCYIFEPESVYTTNDTPDLFTWDISATPEAIPSMRPASHIYVDSIRTPAAVIKMLEDVLYGTPTKNPRFPTINDLFAIFAGSSALIIVDHGDGSWTATGPDDVVRMIDDTTFEINSISAIYIDSDSYIVTSL